MSSLQGWRANNEDTCITVSIGNNSLFAVFDGHGGTDISEHLRDNFAKELEKNEDYKTSNYKKALIDTFIKID